ncbi:MAG: hypothetical protein LBD78_04965 [Spirochaetaceae bacterium]|jgi:hypothetical protein|nr:hypothetical protein [Spirochaetaceae bacterium]
MRKLVFILIAFIAVANFIRAFDYTEMVSAFATERDIAESYSNAGGISSDLSGAGNEAN